MGGGGGGVGGWGRRCGRSTPPLLTDDFRLFHTKKILVSATSPETHSLLC